METRRNLDRIRVTAVLAAFVCSVPPALDEDIARAGGHDASARRAGRTVWRMDTKRKETVLDVNMGESLRLPFAGRDVKQVTGPNAEPGKEDGTIIAPDQVCTLVYEQGAKRVAVRVWENKEHRYFVSPNGDDGNPGSEARPFKTLAHAVQTVWTNDPDGDLYIAGGDYSQGDKALFLRAGISLFGGFDAQGWRRDPIVTQSVLLPEGFRENWVDDVTDRFKDLRRPDHRYFETRIWRDRFPTTGRYNATLTVDHSRRPHGRFYLDGLTVYGCRHVEAHEPLTFQMTGVKQAVVRNCMIVPF